MAIIPDIFVVVNHCARLDLNQINLFMDGHPIMGCHHCLPVIEIKHRGVAAVWPHGFKAAVIHCGQTPVIYCSSESRCPSIKEEKKSSTVLKEEWAQCDKTLK